MRMRASSPSQLIVLSNFDSKAKNTESNELTRLIAHARRSYAHSAHLPFFSNARTDRSFAHLLSWNLFVHADIIQ